MDDYHSKLLFLEQLLGKYKYSSNTKEAEFYCPFCKHYKQKLSINLSTDSYQCWVCGTRGKNLIFIIKKVAGREEVREYLEKYKSKQSTARSFSYEKTDFKLKLPDEFVPIVECKSSIMGKKAFNYLTKVRGVEEIDILRYKIGTIVDGQYENSVVFPSFDKDGSVNFYVVRYYDGRKVSATVPRGYRSQVVFNELNIDWSKPVVIVEGFVDLLKTTGNTIPLFGSSLHKNSETFRKIVENKSDVILALDADVRSGRRMKGERIVSGKSDLIAKSFIHHDVSCYTMDVSPYDDIGEMSKGEFKLRYENAYPVTERNIFKNKLRALC